MDLNDYSIKILEGILGELKKNKLISINCQIRNKTVMLDCGGTSDETHFTDQMVLTLTATRVSE